MPLNPLTFNTVFISESSLKEASIINENVDMKMLTPTIKLIQDIYLLRILGTGLFVDLQNKIARSASGDTNALNSNELFLLDAYIAPLMIWGVMKEAPITLTYKYMNKGIEKMFSDNAQPANMEELSSLIDRASDRFDWYCQRTIFYLNANTQLYPAYLVVRTLDDVAPTVRGYRSRLYVGNGREGSGVCDPRIYYR
jgi:hypothetical protein